MNRRQAILRAVRINVLWAVAIATFTSASIAVFDTLTWDNLASIWFGWLGVAVMIGILRGWSGKI